MTTSAMTTTPKAGAAAKPAEPQAPSASTSVLVRLASRYGVTPTVLLDTVKATLMPPNATNEELVSFLLVADRYQLDPFLKQIYAFPKKGGGIVPMVPIDGWIQIAQNHPQYRGFTQRVVRDDEFGIGIETTIRRADWPEPAVRTEWLQECKLNSGPWLTHPGRMLGHKSFIQDARYAFGISGLYDEDEAKRIADADVVRVSPGTSRTDALERALGERAGTAPAAEPGPAAPPEAAGDPQARTPPAEREPGAAG